MDPRTTCTQLFQGMTERSQDTQSTMLHRNNPTALLSRPAMVVVEGEEVEVPMDIAVMVVAAAAAAMDTAAAGEVQVIHIY